MQRKIEEKLEQRKKDLANFNTFRKCLHVLLNEDFLEIALLDSAILCDLTNEFAHVKESVCTEQIMNTVSYVESLFHAAQKGLPDYDIQAIVAIWTTYSIAATTTSTDKNRLSKSRSINTSAATSISAPPTAIFSSTAWTLYCSGRRL